MDRHSNHSFLDQTDDTSHGRRASLVLPHRASPILDKTNDTSRGRRASLVLPHRASPILDQANDTSRGRRASLVLPHRASTIGSLDSTDGPSMADAAIRTKPYAQSSRRFSISSWRSTQKSQHSEPDDTYRNDHLLTENRDGGNDKRKGGVWDWKPIRAISHIRMRHISCLFSVEVIAVRGLQASTNGLRLAVVVKKEGSKNGAVQTMPSRMLNGCVNFDETLFIKCNLYFTGGTGKPIKFEPKLFDLSVIAVDIPELDFGRSVVNLSSLVLESVEKNMQDNRVREWEKVFKLCGKSNRSELIAKLGFQIMENGDRLGIYGKASYEQENFARAQTKSSFSVASPRVSRSESGMTHSRVDSSRIFKGDDITMEDFNFPEFEVIDKGVEINEEEEEEVRSNNTSMIGRTSSEVVEEVVHYRARRDMQIELDSIAREIKALESMMFDHDGNHDNSSKNQMENLYSEEENLMKEFLLMLEQKNEVLTPRRAKIEGDKKKVLIPNLGKGLGPIIQTRDGGFLVSMNPFNLEVDKEEMPKLVMQVSKLFILKDNNISSGLEMFQRMTAIGSEELASKLSSWANMDELMGKSAEQIAYEGIASTIITGRNKEGANSSATRSMHAIRKMAESMVEGRKERILTGIWNVGEEDPLHIEETLAFSIQKMESMAIDALKIQAGASEEEAPFSISPLGEKDEINCIFDSILPFENWISSHENGSHITILVSMVLRDPSRQYEVVGAPMVAVLRATKSYEEENCSFKVTNLHIGGLQLSSREKQRITAGQWLIAYGLVRKRTERRLQVKGRESVFWSISSRVMADMWIKTRRNPDVKLQN